MSNYPMSQFICQTIFSATVTGTLVLTPNAVSASSLLVEGEASNNTVLASLQFELPDDPVPKTSLGGGVRGKVQFALPGGQEAPTESTGGGVRGKNPALTALIPPTQHGRTVSERPTIFAYLPPLGVQEIFFSLQDEEGESHYHTTLKVSAQGGVISFTLPPEAAALEMEKNYLWYLAPIEPGGILRPDNYAVTGWVKRVEVPRDKINEQELARSPVELATKYAEAGVWYDTLEVLAKAQRSEPNNQTFTKEWQDLLEQVGLGEIASQPLTESL